MIKSVVAVFSLFVFSFHLQARTLNEISASGIIRIGVPGDYAPLAWHDATTGKLQGFEIDLANDFGNELKTRVEFVPTSWPDLARDLTSGAFDIAIGGITATPERAKTFSLSRELLPNGKIALSHCKTSALYHSPESIDRPGVRVVVNPGGTNQSFVEKNIHHAQIIRMGNNLDTLQAIRNQTADVMFTDLLEGEYYHTTEPETFCLTTSQPFKGTQSSKVWMMNNSPDLLRVVNTFMRKERLSALAKRWNIQQ
ncbi:TPA: transporter substrate-binding domain-containing protein [Serratia marcescens]|uniref:transporter substrate-binding domain-containing protein n=1 Tax=Serratia ureilytica TaxID=300181 RepID=UPI0018D623F9|nr:transporter substrate-binding domain-containing protein [Serratia ureilytica]MBH2928739.1 transporter substrate-binding domain-containing protein [Serratia ureilytica]